MVSRPDMIGIVGNHGVEGVRAKQSGEKLHQTGDVILQQFEPKGGYGAHVVEFLKQVIQR